MTEKTLRYAKCGEDQRDPFGVNTNHKDTFCNDLGVVWTNSFTLLGFSLKNTLTKLNINFTNIKEKIEGMIRIWKPYNLSPKGRVTIAQK